MARQLAAVEPTIREAIDECETLLAQHGARGLEHGFSRARYYPVLGGLMAIHHAVRN
jgi:hypothetical protein